MAAESPAYLAYVQGGESSITNETDGMMMITVKDVIPYFYIVDDNTSVLHPVERLANITTPLNAAVTFSGADNESVSLVEVTNLSLSDENKTLIIQVHPLELYEGTVLKSFTDKMNRLTTDSIGKFTNTGIYLEMRDKTPQNRTY
ncbi:MAG: hypothetical protein V1862_13230 [Methanobacteriota archaeon]